MPQTIQGRMLTQAELNKMTPSQLKALEARINVERKVLQNRSDVISGIGDSLTGAAKHIPYIGKPVAQFIDKEFKSFGPAFRQRDDDLSRTAINIPYNYTPDYKGQSFSSHLMGIKPSKRK